MLVAGRDESNSKDAAFDEVPHVCSRRYTQPDLRLDSFLLLWTVGVGVMRKDVNWEAGNFVQSTLGSAWEVSLAPKSHGRWFPIGGQKLTTPREVTS